MTVQFCVLGPLRIKINDVTVTPSAPKIMTALALLLLRANRVVRNDELIDELWGEQPPTTALITLQTYIYRLRKLFSSMSPDDNVVLRTESNGYLFAFPPEYLDLHGFEDLAGQSRVALDAGDALRAASLARRALALWRGAPLASVRAGELLTAHIVRLEESRIRALETSIEAQQQAFGPGTVISDLMELTRTYPMHEGFRQQLILALYRSGRRSEAVAEYERLRRLLRDELGLDPSARLRSLHHALLMDDQSLLHEPITTAQSRPATVEPVPMGGKFGPPAQLPPDIGDFVGRVTELAAAECCLRRADESSTATPI